MDRSIILESIESINDSSLDAEIAVIESMVASYEKYSTIMENYDGDISQFDFVVQEGKVLDEVKKKGKKDDNKIITVLMFIPRLLKALCEIIKKKFGDDIDEKMKNAEKKFDAIKDKKEKEKKVADINKKLEGKAECYIDEKTGKIKFKKDKGAMTSLGWLMITTVTVDGLCKRIEAEFDVSNPSKIRSFVDDCDKIIHGDKSVSKTDLIDGGFAAFGDALKHVTSVTATLTALSGSLSHKAEMMRRKDMLKDVENEKKQEILKNITELSEKIAKINGIIAASIGSVALVSDFVNILFNEGKKFKEDMDQSNKDRETAVDNRITDELKKKYPKQKDETDEHYHARLRAKVLKDMSAMDIERERKQIEKDRIKKEKEDAKEAYRQQKEAWRNKNKKEGDEDNG